MMLASMSQANNVFFDKLETPHKAVKKQVELMVRKW